MLKFMSMMAKSGVLFKGYDIQVKESHQAAKASTPGTAVAIAQSLGLHDQEIVSIRDPEEQKSALHIPAEHLGRHAVHHISIQDAACSITMETRVYGPSPYAAGLAQIINAISGRQLESRLYAIDELFEKGWV
jgi:dihydrodipicolinate reductase